MLWAHSNKRFTFGLLSGKPVKFDGLTVHPVTILVDTPTLIGRAERTRNRYTVTFFHGQGQTDGRKRFIAGGAVTTDVKKTPGLD